MTAFIILYWFNIRYLLIGLTLWKSNSRKKKQPKLEIVKCQVSKNDVKFKSSSSAPQFNLCNEQNKLIDYYNDESSNNQLKKIYNKKRSSNNVSLNVKNCTDKCSSDLSLHETVTENSLRKSRYKSTDLVPNRAKQSRRDVIKMLCKIRK
jgi:hypothetical protein